MSKILVWDSNTILRQTRIPDTLFCPYGYTCLSTAIFSIWKNDMDFHGSFEFLTKEHVTWTVMELAIKNEIKTMRAIKYSISIKLEILSQLLLLQAASVFWERCWYLACLQFGPQWSHIARNNNPRPEHRSVNVSKN